MLVGLNKMPGNAKSTLANREKCCITLCSPNRNNFVATASLMLPQGVLSLRLSSARKLRYVWLVTDYSLA